VFLALASAVFLALASAALALPVLALVPAGAGPSTPVSALAASASASCAAPAHPLQGVWGPSRLRLLAPCRAVTGVVHSIHHQVDGDLTFDLALAPRARSLLDAASRSKLHGMLHVEFMPRDGGHLPVPRAGERVTLAGALVQDTTERFDELHPVWSERIAGGASGRSGPQHGGDPDEANNGNAAASCRDEEGQLCLGYGGTLGRCLPAAGGPGAFADASCMVAASGSAARYRWYPAFGGPAPLSQPQFTSALAPGTILLLETAQGRSVRCSGVSGAGSYGGRRLMSGIALTLTGCVSGGQPCHSPGGSPGEVVSGELYGPIGVVATGQAGPSRNLVGVELQGDGGAPIAQFACGALAVILKGTAIGLLQGNSMLRSASLTFHGARGRQSPARFESTSPVAMQASFGGSLYEPASLSLALVLTNAEPLELDSAI
jgi:hypothetical protein